MSYQKEIKNHFENQKEILFGKIEKGTWRNSEKIYSHILPEKSKILNLLPAYRNDLNIYIENNKKSLKKHIYFHHLNSSQAMCLNFFFPLYQEKELDVILKAVGFINESVDYEKTCFEKKSEIDNVENYRPTYFDFFITTKTSKKIFFEIKYTEQEFGKAADDAVHKTKFNEVYKGHLNVLTENFREPSIFFKNYQILRNLICVAENSYVVFIYPLGNKKIKSQAESAKLNMLTKNLADNLINLPWENLLDYTVRNVKNEKLKLQYINFRIKFKV